MITADAPGIGTIGISEVIQPRRSGYPGSEMIGVPASETRAIFFTYFHAINQFVALYLLISFKVACERGLNVIVRQETACLTCVLSGDEVYLFKDT